MNVKTVTAVFSELTGTAILVFMAVLAEQLPEDERVAVISIGLIAFFAGIIAAVNADYNNGEYTCGKCGQTFMPSLIGYMFGAHIGRIRHLRCPHCNKKSWCKRNKEGRENNG